jgi:hypothetical protein
MLLRQPLSGGIKETHEERHQDKRSPNINLNPGLLEYEATVIHFIAMLGD